MKVSVNGIDIHYRIDGPEGAPWVTLSNSLACDLGLWEPQMAALTARYRVLRYDTRGHGQSSAPEGPYSFPMLVADLEGLLTALEIERTALVGLSLGGMTALSMALTHPERLSGIAVCDARADAPPVFRDSWDGRIAALQAGGMEALVAPTLERWFTPAFIEAAPAATARVAVMIRETPAAGYLGCVGALLELDYLPQLGAITLPTLFIVGQQDMGAPPEAMRSMHEAVGGSQFVALDPAGHLSNIENVEGFNAALLPFLEACEAR